MTLQRRSFLAGILAGAAAPAIVRASSLMKIWVPPQDLIRGDCRIIAAGDLVWADIELKTLETFTITVPTLGGILRLPP